MKIRIWQPTWPAATLANAMALGRQHPATLGVQGLYTAAGVPLAQRQDIRLCRWCRATVVQADDPTCETCRVRQFSRWSLGRMAGGAG